MAAKKMQFARRGEPLVRTIINFTETTHNRLRHYAYQEGLSISHATVLMVEKCLDDTGFEVPETNQFAQKIDEKTRKVGDSAPYYENRCGFCDTPAGAGYVDGGLMFNCYACAITGRIVENRLIYTARLK